MTAQMQFLADPVTAGDPGGPAIDHKAFHTRALTVAMTLVLLD